MKVKVNGQDLEMLETATVLDLVDHLHGVRRGLAVARDGALVPRTTWNTERLAAGQSFEILTAVQGG